MLTINDTSSYNAPLATITSKMPICKELLLDELNIGLTLLNSDNFISYKTVKAFDDLVLNQIIELLSIYYAKDNGMARETANTLIARLQSLDTDGDSFPEFEI